MARRTSIYLRGELENNIKARGDEVSALIDRDLNRLYYLYSRSLQEINLENNELCLILDVQKGSLMDAQSAIHLWAKIEDGIQFSGMGTKWEIDGPSLIAKIKGMSSIQCLAIVDSAERFWHEYPQGDISELAKKFFS